MGRRLHGGNHPPIIFSRFPWGGWVITIEDLLQLRIENLLRFCRVPGIQTQIILGVMRDPFVKEAVEIGKSNCTIGGVLGFPCGFQRAQNRVRIDNRLNRNCVSVAHFNKRVSE